MRVNEYFNSNGVVIFEELNPYGQVRFKGEIWNAVSVDQTTIPEGEKVKVVGSEMP